MIMDRLYGGVCYAGIDTDPELKYPKGAGRVAFSNQQSYIAAISARFVQLQHNDIDKRVSNCLGYHCYGKEMKVIPWAPGEKNTLCGISPRVHLGCLKKRIPLVFKALMNCLFPPSLGWCYTYESNAAQFSKTNQCCLKDDARTSLVVQWLRLSTPSAGDLGSTPGEGTRSHMPQLKILCAARKSWWSQINKYFWKKDDANSTVTKIESLFDPRGPLQTKNLN